MAFRYFIAIFAIGTVCCDAFPTFDDHKNLGVNVTTSGIVPSCAGLCALNTTDVGHVDKTIIDQRDILGNSQPLVRVVRDNVITGNGHHGEHQDTISIGPHSYSSNKKNSAVMKASSSVMAYLSYAIFMQILVKLLM